MKKLLLVVFITLPVSALAQSTNQNYTKVTTYKKANSQGSVDVSNPENAVQQVVYYDGLGRPIQQIAHKQSNTGKDIVTHIEYDTFGRQTKEYLPFANQSPSLSYNSSANTDVLSFYNTAVYENTSNPYNEKLFENSPLNRVFRQAAPGNEWALNPLSDDHSIKFDYTSNISEEVKHYKVSLSWSATYNLYEPTLVNASGNDYYAPNQLYKTITKDENWISGKNNTTEEFKDKEGRIVLKRTYSNIVEGGVVVSFEEKHDTYYVYDVYGNLTYVIPPLVNTSSVIDDTVLNGLCYQYKYDYRNRLVEKKLPGKQWEFIVYDRLDRVVATGPALNPFGGAETGWLITKYDVFNRVVYTGWYTGKETTALGRKDFSDLHLNNALTEDVSENVNIDGANVGYTNRVLPTTGYKILTINYYDRYDYPGAPEVIPSTILDDVEVYFNNTHKPKGLVTSVWNRVLTTPEELLWEKSYMLYDKKARVIRTNISNEYFGGYTQIDTKLDFSGKILLTETRHKYSENDTELLVTDTFEYTPQDKLELHHQQINQGINQLIAKNSYDELGQLISKNVGGDDITGAIGLQKVDYTYNIRGWLKSINNVNDISSGNINVDNDLFAFKINYTAVENTLNGLVGPLYNGNISETFWASSSDNILRKYGYKYDDLNRLLKAVYQKPGGNVEVPHSYDEYMSYDKNGNILNLTRNGDQDSNQSYIFAQTIDNLTYTYDEQNPNRLLKVFDSEAYSTGFTDDSDGINDPDEDYTYDANGNMKSDANKNISSIAYNHLNLPTEIQFGAESKIQYIYTAAGQKIQKRIVDYLSGGGSVVGYINGFQYKGGILQFFPHTEGYVNVTESHGVFSYNYVFNYTDHLGNIRLSYGVDPQTSVLKIMEENHYYPFGLKHTNYNSDFLLFQKGETEGIVLRPPGPTTPSRLTYNYKYNGKELQDELGLNFYDYGARNYDPAIGRWMNIDPLAEKFNSMSPYVYGLNDPANVIDPDGQDGIRVVDTKNKTITIKAVYYVQTEKSSYYAQNGKIKEINGYSSKEIASMQKDYNKYLNGLGMNVSEGEYSGYSVKFDLQFKEGGTVEASKESAKNTSEEGYSIGNSISVGNAESYSKFKSTETENADGTISTSVTGGTTFDKKDILMNSSQDGKMNRIHEIFHTLGLSHPKNNTENNGVMKYPPEKPNQNDINKVGNGSFLPIVNSKN
ncbi:DUF6443 domain-containing protein [Flavobacterium suncheonense]|uniref:DUF6443 domain-containing protein n=1 Tax=Flavobacterium suncheonense TaxID=350894 RepID=UPI003FA3CB20